MDLARAKILLDKINRLYKSMSLDEENVAPIEEDLMRDYIKQLYATFLVESDLRVPVKTRKTAPKATYTPPPTPKVKKVVAPPPPPPVVVEEVEIPEVVVEEAVTPPPPPMVVETVPVVAPTPKRKATPSYTVDPEHSDLFSLNMETKELSEKLGQTRISDLNNAMGLNERIFTVNELFGANNSLYRNVISDLNGLSSFEEAKAYLSANVAEAHNWTHKSKRNKAKNFIKLVRRRYL